MRFHANGKLLVSSEYFVLDGAKALALPCRFGQSMEVIENQQITNHIFWKSIDIEGYVWFSATLELTAMQIVRSDNVEVGKQLLQFFEVLKQLNPNFFQNKKSYEIKTFLEFPKDWGLGSSSTLIYNLAQWTNTNPYELLLKTMGGSGYDIACAAAKQAIVFSRVNDEIKVENVFFKPAFTQNIYFVYLEKKQNSRDGIARYRQRIGKNHETIQTFTDLTQSFLESLNQKDFEKNIEQHENLIAELLDLPKAKDLYFTDFQGSIKSLGAWGGDFVMAISQLSETETKNYFHSKGFMIVLKYEEMII